MLAHIARISYRHRRLVVGAWLLVVVGLFALAGAAGGESKTEFSIPGAESQQARDLLAESGFGARTGQSGQVVFEAAAGVDDPTVQTDMERLFAQIERETTGIQVVSPYDTTNPAAARQVADNGRVAYAEVNFPHDRKEAQDAQAKTIKGLAQAAERPGLRIELGGAVFQDSPDFSSEMYGVFFAVIILLVAFGSVLAMGLPIGTALLGVACGIALVQIGMALVDMPDFTVQVASMIGIGVGIDYALFIVTRYRESLQLGLDPEESTVRAIDTAGRAVLFAGTTVVISVMGMLLIGLDFIRGMSIGIAVTVAMTMLGSITFLPALLGFVGHNIDRLRVPHRHRSGPPRATVWYRWSRVVQRRPWPGLVAGLVFLLLLAAPLLSMRLGVSDTGNNPKSDTSRRAYDVLARSFGPGFNGPLILVAATPDGAADQEVLARISSQLVDAPGVASVSPVVPSPAGSAALVQVIPDSSPQSKQTADLVEQLRNELVPAASRGTGVEVLVGGITAAGDDFAQYISDRLPVFIGAVLLLSFLLLMVVFRSLLVPLKAVIMNLLSIGAAYGVVVAVFQRGWGLGFLGLGDPSPIESWAPMMLFAIVFGLSMDYEVFLLSRIREEYDRTGDNAVAVADGLAVTARVITAAAAIMFFVFGAFVLGDQRALQLFGMGLAVAVLLDATVVRLVLVPATMELLGDLNWWIPKWLDRILPRVHVEAPPLPDEIAREDREPALTDGR